MWWKLLLLTLYLAVLFLLSRLLETVAYFEGGYLSSRLLDPVSLSVKRLKTLLDQRGVSYAGVVEKQELTDLVDASGEVSDGEMEAATLSEDEASSTNFTCGSHFYEEVEDTKDSVWVVQVIYDGVAYMRNEEWKAFVKKVARFGVRTGIFDCSLDWRLCDRKQWHTSRLIMGLPQGQKAKDNVMLRSYAGSTKTQAVLDWVNYNLASRIRGIYDYEEVKNIWFHWYQMPSEVKVKVILFSRMTIQPMFFSVLSVKFTGRVKFGTVNINTKEGKNILNRLRLDYIPLYMVLTPEGNYTFGAHKGEYLNYHSMALYLKTLHPEVNDLFLLSLILVNVACWFELVTTHGNVFCRLGNTLWCLVKWNCILILLWLPVLGLFQLPYMDSLLNHVLMVLRILSTTTFSASLRLDWLWILSGHFAYLVCTFVMYIVFVGFLHHWYVRDNDETDIANNNNSDWWNFNWDGYMNHLFRPMTTLTRPMGTQNMDLEVGMELLIERLAVPNFWLRPMISSDYLKELPVWRYTGASVDSDFYSDTECTKSDGEEATTSTFLDGASRSLSLDSIRRLPDIFTCEKCRALQKEKENMHKSQEELEQERAENVSACAKFLMDGDYKCSCACHKGSPKKSKHSSRNPNRSPAKIRARSLSPEHIGAMNSRDGGQAHSENYKGHGCYDDDISDHWPPGILPTSDCVICLESYKYNVTLCGLPCGHSFHHQCIMGWLSRDNHCCPVCRWPTYKAKPCNRHLHSQ